MEQLKAKIAPYPAAIPRRGPGHSFYQRGRGSGYIRKTDGKITWGKKKSQRMGDNWRVKAGQNRGVLYNNVTYSQYVVGRKQTAVHKGHNWPDAHAKAEKFLPEAERIMKRYTEARLQRRYK